MKRSNMFVIPNQDTLERRKHCIAFHEAGHAAAIYLNNMTRNLPPVFFQIIIKDLCCTSEDMVTVYQVMHEDYVAKIKSGNPSNSNPSPASNLYESPDHRRAALEVNIVNLLIGPLAEAKYIALADGEPFNRHLVNLPALKNYGGSSDIDQAYEYLRLYSNFELHQNEKIHELFIIAADFIKDNKNWQAISRLANYILDSNQNIISCEEVASVLED